MLILKLARKSGFYLTFENNLKQNEEIPGRVSQNEVVSAARRR